MLGPVISQQVYPNVSPTPYFTYALPSAPVTPTMTPQTSMPPQPLPQQLRPPQCQVYS